MCYPVDPIDSKATELYTVNDLKGETNHERHLYRTRKHLQLQPR